MLCENCKENEATIHYIEIINGVKTEHHLCSACADKLDLSDYVSVLDIDIPFVKLLTGLLSSNGANEEESDNPMVHVKCPKCGMNFIEFTKVGKFGCEECYDVFGPLIEDNMKKLHGSIEHKGKVYQSNIKSKASKKISTKSENEKKETSETKVETIMDQIAELNRQLKEAIRTEDYEKAATIRDQVKALKERDGKNA